jgi:endonuclease/exonuclease/phosphatase family metal-dependent hydrolase
MIPTSFIALFLTFVLSYNTYINTNIFVRADTECPIVSNPGDRRSNKNSLRLVQYNAEWLFIDYCSSAKCPGSGCSWQTTADAQTHMSYITNVIKTLNPDIVNFCEVEGCDELNLLINGLNDATYKSYLKQGTDTSTGQNVGMITRVDPLVSLYRSEERASYPIAGSKCGYTGAAGTSGVSKHYITEFNLGGLKTALIGAHLLAIPTEPTRCAEREAQAQVLQNVVAGYIAKGYEVILLGDMNDFDAEVLDVNSDKPTSYVLDIMKGLYGQKKGTYTLTNAATKMAQSERYSDWWDSDDNCATNSPKDYSMIDHVLMSSKIFGKISKVSIYHGYTEYCGTMNSDHYPVVVDLSFS